MTGSSLAFFAKRRGLVAGLSAIGLALGLFALGVLRRHPSEIDDLYDIGNVLNGHDASELSRNGFGVDLAHLEFAVLLALVLGISLYSGAIRSRLAASVAIAVSFGVIFVDSLTRDMTTVAGHLYVGMCDDALISMRYARNFAEGRGLVYNAGEYVDGFSNPLWTFIMVVPQALHLHEGVATLPVTLLGGASAARRGAPRARGARKGGRSAAGADPGRARGPLRRVVVRVRGHRARDAVAQHGLGARHVGVCSLSGGGRSSRDCPSWCWRAPTAPRWRARCWRGSCSKRPHAPRTRWWW